MPPLRKAGCAYILTNKWHTVLYTGMSSDLRGRIWEHRMHKYPKSFTARYNCTQLVYFACFDSIAQAVTAEKRIKGGSRFDKETLIRSKNPDWEDLWDSIQEF